MGVPTAIQFHISETYTMPPCVVESRKRSLVPVRPTSVYQALAEADRCRLAL